jgi:hypothetical protein
MATWKEFSQEAPDIAGLAEGRLVATGLMMLATLRRDGFRASARWSGSSPAIGSCSTKTSCGSG